MSIVKIEASETKIFATKSKTNFMVCFQLIKPEEFLMRNTLSLRDNFEKYIKDKCSRMIALEIKGENARQKLK